MADNKKYYYLKVKENFYDSEEMIILQNMQDGYLYSDILMKLYLRSLKNEGKLMFKNTIPYNSQILSQVVRHSVGVVEKALNIFKGLGLVEVLDNGAIYMLDIQNFIGKSSSEADRQRNYYNKIKEEKQTLIPNSEESCKKPYMISTPEKELELKKDIIPLSEKFPDEVKLINLLINKMKMNNPKAKIPAKLDNWIKAINKMYRLDNYTYKEIQDLIEFSQKDSFWKSNILSATKLRDKAGTLILRMKPIKQEKKKKEFKPVF